MKSSKTLKLFVFILFIIITASVFAVFGEADEAVPEIIGKNVVYTDKTALRFAVSAESVDTNDVSLILTKPDGTEIEITSYQIAEETVNGADGALVFTIEGVPASAICDEYTVVARSGDRKSEPLTYSVAEYFFERLYSDGIINATADNALAIRQKTLYLNYLAYAESSQELFKNYYGGQDVTLVSDYSYIGGSHAVFANGTDSMLSVNSFSTTVTADETLSADKRFLNRWVVTAYGEETTASTVENGATVEASGMISVTPVYTDAKGDYYLSDEAGERVDYDLLGAIAADSVSYSGSTGKFEISDGALHFEDGDAENQEMIAKYPLEAPDSYNVTVFEFDFKLMESEAVGSYPIIVKIANQQYGIYCSETYDSSYGTGKKLCMKIDGVYLPFASLGEWSTVRFEHYYDKAKLKVFVNNEFLCDIATNKGSIADSVIQLTAKERSKDSDADLYVDNVYVGHLTKSFVEGDPTAAN